MDMSKAPQVVKDNMARMQKNHLEKCYGINAVDKNDCAEGTHSCAGQATQDERFSLPCWSDTAKRASLPVTPLTALRYSRHAERVIRQRPASR